MRLREKSTSCSETAREKGAFLTGDLHINTALRAILLGCFSFINGALIPQIVMTDLPPAASVLSSIDRTHTQSCVLGTNRRSVPRAYCCKVMTRFYNTANAPDMVPMYYRIFSFFEFHR